jgi:hypothetical protein
MTRFAHAVAIIEIANASKKGATPVDICGSTFDLGKRMGLFDQIEASRLHERSTQTLTPMTFPKHRHVDSKTPATWAISKSSATCC